VIHYVIFNAEEDNYSSIYKTFDWVETHTPPDKILDTLDWTYGHDLLLLLMLDISLPETNGFTIHSR